MPVLEGNGRSKRENMNQNLNRLLTKLSILLASIKAGNN